jgi:hypothetical protein
MINMRLKKKRLKVNRYRNFRSYLELEHEGWQYIINPDTGELHGIEKGNFLGCPNLINANLERFYPVVNDGEVSVKDIDDREEIEVFDVNRREVIGTYRVNKCEQCF